MRTERHSVFETNSSSTHTISVPKSKVLKRNQTIAPSTDGRVHLLSGEYGWEWDIYETAAQKAAYVLTLYSHVESKHHKLKELKFKMEEYLGYPIEFVRSKHSYVETHNYNQLYNENPSIETLLDYIFSSKVKFFCGNDNESPRGTKAKAYQKEHSEYKFTYQTYHTFYFYLNDPFDEEVRYSWINHFNTALHDLLNTIYGDYTYFYNAECDASQIETLKEDQTLKLPIKISKDEYNRETKEYDTTFLQEVEIEVSRNQNCK